MKEISKITVSQTDAPSTRRNRSSRIKHLYHLAETTNIESILQRGLMSTEQLLIVAEIPEFERAAMLRSHRPANVQLPNGILIRDQKPMPPKALAGALDDCLEPADWYAMLNSFVFLWPDKQRMERQRIACGSRPQALLTFDAQALLRDFGTDAFVSPINSGNARRKPARRDSNTLSPYSAWKEGKQPTERGNRPPAEFLFRCRIPAEAPYLIQIDNI
jgi:hypothetical protein